MCTQCSDPVRVYEIPVEHIDPARYRCFLCDRSVPVLFRDPTAGMREEARPYDPDLAAFPTGF